jgi:hypothetical protein
MSDLQATASHFETCAAMIEEHIASIESGVTGVPAVVAAMNIQSKVAAATGALKVDIALLDMENAAELQSALLSIENGVKSWLGKDFKSYFEVSSEAARLGSMINIVEEQSLSADAMMSDVEAGLRVGDAMVSAKHSGFIINMGQASAQEVLMLMEQVRTRVYADSGILLEPEIRMIKEDSGWNL